MQKQIRVFRYYFFLILILTNLQANSRPLSINQLEQKVYELNNSLKYKESQRLLLPLLSDKSLSSAYRSQASVLLSYTYKRVFDYQSALKFLDQAQRLAYRSSAYKSQVAVIQAEKAFIYFDTNEYIRADELMRKLNRSGFKYLTLENKAKLLMQQGYLLFLAKKYKAAEVAYDKAIFWMRASTPCHLPMILVKKMQLYNAMDRTDLLNKTIRLSNHCADSCHILKYHLYANEELLSIYLNRNDLTHIKSTKKKLDSLNELYKREENIASLHSQKEAILLNVKNQEVQDKNTFSNHLIGILIGSILLIVGLIGCLYVYYKHKLRAEANYQLAKRELDSFLAKASQTSSPFQLERLQELSQQQRRVLDCLTGGMSNKQIAGKLFISENTVKYHVKNIYQLLNIKDRKDLLVTIHTVNNTPINDQYKAIPIRPDLV